MTSAPQPIESPSAGEVLADLIALIARALVDAPEAVEVHRVESGSTVIIELSVAKDDIGKIIGRRGNTAGALRTLLSNAATKLKRRAVLEILE